jgi:autotransporter-associated beta strand protein
MKPLTSRRPIALVLFKTANATKVSVIPVTLLTSHRIAAGVALATCFIMATSKLRADFLHTQEAAPNNAWFYDHNGNWDSSNINHVFSRNLTGINKVVWRNTTTTYSLPSLSISSAGNFPLQFVGHWNSSGQTIVLNGNISQTASSLETFFGMNTGGWADFTTDLIGQRTFSIAGHWHQGTLTGSGGLTKAGSGRLELHRINSYAGSTDVNQGELLLATNGAIPDGSRVTVSSGTTFNLGGFSESIGSLSGSGTVSLGSGTLNTGGDNTSTTSPAPSPAPVASRKLAPER